MKTFGDTDKAMAERRAEVRRYLRDGYSQKDIVAFLGYSQATISLDMKAIALEDRAALSEEHEKMAHHYQLVISNYEQIRHELWLRVRDTKSARDAAVLYAELIKVNEKILSTMAGSDVILATVENSERIMREAKESLALAKARLVGESGSSVREEEEEQQEQHAVVGGGAAGVVGGGVGAVGGAGGDGSGVGDVDDDDDGEGVALFTTATASGDGGGGAVGDGSGAVGGVGAGGDGVVGEIEDSHTEDSRSNSFQESKDGLNEKRINPLKGSLSDTVVVEEQEEQEEQQEHNE